MSAVASKRVAGRAARRAFASALVGSVVASGVVMGSAGVSQAVDTNPNRYSLTAHGDGMTFSLADDQLPATTFVEVSPYSAFSQVDSQNNSTAFAGLPYFGAFGQTLPGTLNGLSGGNLPPLPPIPGYVESKHPTKPESHESQGPYFISAKSSAFGSSSTAGFGVSPNAGDSKQQVFSTSSVIANPDGSVVAKATAGVDGLSLGPLDILNFSSSESITETGSGPPVVDSKSNLGTISVLGFKLGVDQDGFTVLGANLPLPVQTVLSTVNSALGKAGLEVSVVPSKTFRDPITSATTVTSSLLRVTSKRTVPTQGPVTVIYTFGRSVVSSSDVKDGGLLPTVPLPVDSGSLPPAPVASSGGGVPTGSSGSTGGSPAMPQLNPGAVASTDVPAPAIAPVDPGTPTQPRTLGFIGGSATTGTNSGLIYLVVALGAVGVLIGQQLFSRFGVRLLLRQG